MTPLDGIKRELEESLMRRGWRISEMERPFEYEWGAEEFWVLQCDDAAAPAIWLTFLVDPVSDGREVWAVLAGRERPDGFQTAAGRPQLELTDDWAAGVNDFIDQINEWSRLTGS